MTRRTTIPVAIALALSLALVSCGSSSDDAASDASTTTAAGGGSCETGDLALKEAGKLQVATGEPAFPPWVGGDDEPESGEGYEAALVYALADQLGLAEEDVSWTRTGFDEAVAPGDKDYDFNIQQYSITEERQEVVDFSDGYYTVEQALVGEADGAIADATSIADLKTARLGAAIGTTSLDYIENYIKPDTAPLVFDDNAAAKAAFDAKQVDGIVFDVPTAYYVTAAEIEGSAIVGVLPVQGPSEELGLLFEKGSPLVDCVNEALAALDEDGTIADLQTEWLDQGGDIPTLTK